MDYKNPEHFLFLKEIILEAGELAIQTRKKELYTKYKQDRTPVTNADILISDFIYKKLKQLSPAIPVVSEEFPYKDLVQGRYEHVFWLVDPIDGTESFILNKENFTINIALIINSQPRLGFIYKPISKELYYTDHNRKICFEKNRQIQEGFCQINTKDRFVAVLGSKNFNQETIQYLKEYRIDDVEIIPSSIKLCFIAIGVADVYPKFGDTMQWDIAAGHALINASGGKIFNLSNDEIFYQVSDFHNSYLIAMSYQFFKKFYDK